MDYCESLEGRLHACKGIVDLVGHKAYHLGIGGFLGEAHFVGKTFDHDELTPESAVHKP